MTLSLIYRPLAFESRDLNTRPSPEFTEAKLQLGVVSLLRGVENHLGRLREIVHGERW